VEEQTDEERPQCDSLDYMAVDVGGGSRGERISSWVYTEVSVTCN
jgi:hypothetical protein